MLQFRYGNPFVFALRITRAGTPFVPTSFEQVFLEIRESEPAYPLAEAELIKVANDTLLLATFATMPKQRQYVAGLRFESAGIVHRVGVCSFEILPAGSLTSIDEIQGLNVSITETNATLSVELDATPAAMLIASYAQQAIGSLLISKKSFAVVNSKTELLALPSIPDTLLEVFVRIDESKGNTPTTYNILPNGDRYLTSFLIVKDN